MILALLGTQPQGFPRLLAAIDDLMGKGVITEPVIAQCGHTKYLSNREGMELIDFIPRDEFRRIIDRADLIITHGGVGSILNCVKAGKKVIAVPRNRARGEHVNDHQSQIVEAFDALGYVKGVSDVWQLEEALQSVGSFKPAPYKSNTDRFIEIVAGFIDTH
jgi:UDP-N-acetylglucosamine transferase subunit ALG13